MTTRAIPCKLQCHAYSASLWWLSQSST